MREGFFYGPLGRSILGDESYRGVLYGDGPPPGAEAASLWVAPDLLRPRTADEVRLRFQGAGAVPRVALEGALLAPVAAALRHALPRARFTRHHHPGYELDVARRPHQLASPLTAFVDWLETAEAAAYHLWLVGRELTRAPEVQVQVSRMAPGDFFPRHYDTDEPGIACIYNLTGAWDDALGGHLRLFHPKSGALVRAYAPSSNTLVLFEPRVTPHEVSEVTEAAGDRRRFTVTAFYLCP